MVHILYGQTDQDNSIKYQTNQAITILKCEISWTQWKQAVVVFFLQVSMKILQLSCVEGKSGCY